MGWGAAIGGIVGGLGSIIGGSSSASSAKAQAKAQLQATRETNEMNERLFHESRGSKGHAWLPEYFGNFEQNLGLDLRDLYYNDPGSDTIGEDTYAGMKDSFLRGNELIDSVLSGEVGDQRTELTQQANQARRAAINNAMTERLAKLKQARKRSGLSGTSSFQEKQMLGETVDARVAAALSEAEAMQQLYDQNLQLQLGLIDAPFQRAQMGYEMGNLGRSEQYRAMDEVLKRLGYFNIGTGQPPVMQTPEIATIPNTGQFVGAALGQVGSGIMQYYLGRQQTPTTTTPVQTYTPQQNANFWANGMMGTGSPQN